MTKFKEQLVGYLYKAILPYIGILTSNDSYSVKVDISKVWKKSKIYLSFHFHFYPLWLTMMWNAPTEDDVTILGSNCKGEKYLLTLEALFQNDIKPSLNTKDEYKSRTLTIKF